MRLEPLTEETYTLTVDATGLPAGEIIGFSVVPEEVVRYSEATFMAMFRNEEEAAVTVSGLIDVYYLGEHGRGFPIWRLFLEERTVEPGKSTGWIIPHTLPFIPGCYEATARLDYNGMVAEKTIGFSITPRGTGIFTGVVSSAVTGLPIEG
ncbi:hypothetical protein M1O14_00800 [Dehalococcoidia bacterium]|nr:hypothetical protein [Dehalococcoidia bacterium]